MQFRQRLRSRIILSFALFGIGLTALFAVAALVLRAKLEDQLINQTLAETAAEFVRFKRVRPEPEAIFKFSPITGEIYGVNKFANVPFAWQAYGTGVYDIDDLDERGQMRRYKLAVNRTDDLWAFLKYDVTNEARSREVLVVALLGAMLVFAALSVGIAVWLSKRVLQPVTELVDRVRVLGDDAKPEALAPHFAPDEVGLLAATLDDYARRLTALVDRDREFNADVSHELRTPLAVIRGATELLLAQDDLPEKSLLRLRRIERATRQSSELTEALLLLSRGERARPAGGDTSVLAVVEQLVETYRPQLGSKPVAVRIESHADPRLDAPAAVLAVALGNLVGNAFKYTAEGEIVLHVSADSVRVEDTGPGIKPDESAHLFQRGVRGEGAVGQGAGLGLAILSRLCEH